MIPLSRRIPRQTQSKALRLAELPFGEWLPDLAPYENPGCLEALNVLPAIDGYKPLPDITSVSDALDARCQGAAAAQDAAGNVDVFAGDATKLYLLKAQTFSDASKAGGYTTPVDAQWEFALFGDKFIATNFTDPIQAITLSGSTFADLITSSLKPKAKHLAVVRDHLVLGNTNDGTDGHKPNRVFFSAINDATDFDPSATTLADFQDIPDGGAIEKVVGGVEYGLIFQERSISRMTFVGSPLVFRFDKIDRRRGTPIPGSVVEHGRMVFFISEEGFFYNDGTRSVPIGQNKVDQTFWNQFDIANESRVTSAIDPINKVCVWAFPGTGNSNGTPNKLFFYDYMNGRWSQGEIDTDIVLRTLNQGFTLDQLDTFGNLDALAYSLDSRAWTGGEFKLGAFDTSHRLNFFSGSNLAATLETSERDLETRSKLRGIYPIVDGGTVTASVASRARIMDSVASFPTAVAVNSTNGMTPFISEGRYHKAQVKVAAGGTWTRAKGVKLLGAPTGKK